MAVFAIPVTASDPTGGISGRITTQDTTCGIANATLKVVDSDDNSSVFYTCVSDEGGYYAFVDVNTTGTPSGYYQVIASAIIDGQLYEGYSNSFSVEPNSTAQVNVVIFVPEAPTPITGGISGRVTTQNTTQGIANATLKVVDPDDLSSVIYTGVSDQNGFFQFVGVNISGTPSGYYKIIASVDIDGQTCEGYSVSFRVEENSTAAVSIVIEVPENPAPTAPGSISGRVTFNGNIGAPYAVVMIVDASDPSVVYYTGTANSRGYFQFTGVNNTWDPASGQYEDKYKVYATSRNRLLKFTGYSGSFAVESDSTAVVNVQVTRSP